jgi:hypothetical protein
MLLEAIQPQTGPYLLHRKVGIWFVLFGRQKHSEKAVPSQYLAFGTAFSAVALQL